MGRTGWLSVVALAALAVGWALHLSRPSKETALPCPPDEVRWVDAGTARIARCAPELPPNPGPAAQALTVGQKLDLNRASEHALEVLPGVGPALAHAIVSARAREPFRSWDDVDRIPGIGPSKLSVLKAHAEIHPAR